MKKQKRSHRKHFTEMDAQILSKSSTRNLEALSRTEKITTNHASPHNQNFTPQNPTRITALSKDQSAQTGLWPSQKIFLTLAITIVTPIGLFIPSATAAIATFILSLFFTSIVALRIYACLLRPQNHTTKKDEPNHPGNWPVYTILVPLYQEANMLEVLTECLIALDYPPDRLDIKIILESDDHETCAAAAALKLPPQFEFVTVRPSDPRTKPKALNHALERARGTYITIYDAEDQPEPDQLKKCVKTFQQSPETVACLQAKLNFYNGTENWLTKQFTIEYASLFDAILPALEKLQLPIPLGGTSNHFRTSALKKVGAWDAYNLTEDADLGIRLYRNGLRSAMIDSTTYEEANCQLTNWVKQRSRWLKGWVQTYFVHMRNPYALWQQLGTRGFLGFQAILGGLIISALVHPLYYLALLISFAASNSSSAQASIYTETIMCLALFNLSIGYLSAMLLALRGMKARKLQALTKHILILPIYWFLISFAAYRALYQLTRTPFLWEKTKHGISCKPAQAQYG